MAYTLHEGEKLLYQRDRVGFAVYKSAPTLHAAGSLPGLHTIALLVTNRRVIIKGVIIGGVQVTEFDLWYPESVPSADCDVLERASVAKSRLSGKYLHLTARAREHGPLRSDVLEMYLTMDEADRVSLMLETTLAEEPAEWR